MKDKLKAAYCMIQNAAMILDELDEYGSPDVDWAIEGAGENVINAMAMIETAIQNIKDE